MAAGAELGGFCRTRGRALDAKGKEGGMGWWPGDPGSGAGTSFGGGAGGPAKETGREKPEGGGRFVGPAVPGWVPLYKGFSKCKGHGTLRGLQSRGLPLLVTGYLGCKVEAHPSPTPFQHCRGPWRESPAASHAPASTDGVAGARRAWHPAWCLWAVYKLASPSPGGSSPRLPAG